MNRLAQLRADIIGLNPMQRAFLDSSVATLTTAELSTLDTYLAYCEHEGVAIDELARCYDLIVKDTLAQQVYFLRNRRYRYSSFAEVESLVYRNDSYMRRYMYGLALTGLLWPNHAQLFRYFVHTLPTAEMGRYLEIGPGHGFYFMEAMRRSSYRHFLGIDISPTSVAMTHSIVGSGFFGRFSDWEIREEDFLDWSSTDQYDAIVMGEVLEHVECPDIFLRQIAHLSHRTTHIYVTTCINSPAIDHIYLFASIADVLDLVERSGLAVTGKLLVPYTGLSLDETVEQRLPLNIALVLRKP